MNKGISTIKMYWRAYGGAKALFSSRYFWSAIVLTVANYSRWTQPQWWDDPISIEPNLLGFTLGGLALFLAFSEERFHSILASKELDDKEEFSDLVVVVATFVHFIFVQVIAILAAISLRTFYNEKHFTSIVSPLFFAANGEEFFAFAALRLFIWFAAYLAFMYSITLIAATAFNLLRLSNLYSQTLQYNETVNENKSVDVKNKNNN